MACGNIQSLNKWGSYRGKTWVCRATCNLLLKQQFPTVALNLNELVLFLPPMQRQDCNKKKAMPTRPGKKANLYNNVL